MKVIPLGCKPVFFTFDSQDIMYGFVNDNESWLSQWVEELKPWEPIFTPSK